MHPLRRYGLALWRGEIFVADAHDDRICVLRAARLSAEPLRYLGSAGSLPGELGAPRGVALWHQQAASDGTPARRLQSLHPALA